ncbi:TatD family hydrolase [Flavobacterium sp.]|uniref:TatD family hydrolase n=1 Tax=Flavobacterium sp. TaxID=239 RepID=UPI003526F7A4
MQYINLHTHRFSNQKEVFEIVNQYPNEFSIAIPQYSIGIHPWYIALERLQNDIQLISEKLQEKNCLALGECGLDKRIETPLAIQTTVFQQQIEMVQTTLKPIIVHCVAAYEEVIAIKKEMNIKNPIIIHGFSKNKQVAKSLLDNGLYLSFGKQLLQNPNLEEVFNFVPHTCFFLETDTITENIETVYKKAASIKKVNIEALKAQVNENYHNIFK